MRALGADNLAYVEDVAQETLAVVFVKLSTWKPCNSGSLRAWIVKIARRRALNCGLAARRRLRHQQNSAPQTDQSGLKYTEDANWEFRDLVQAIQTQLTERQRLVLERLLEESSQSEIAQAVGVSASTVRADLRAIGDCLERILGKFGK